MQTRRRANDWDHRALKKITLLLVLCALATEVSISVASEASNPKFPPGSVAGFHERGSILGVDLKAIQAALPIFEKHGLKIDDYKVVVIEDREFVVVIFDDPDRPPGQIGSTARKVAFEVRLRRSDRSVVGSNFVR